MERIPCYERGDGGSIPSGGANGNLLRCGHNLMVKSWIVIPLIWVQFPVVTPKNFSDIAKW